MGEGKGEGETSFPLPTFLTHGHSREGENPSFLDPHFREDDGNNRHFPCEIKRSL